jgi:hypothetical protein
MAGPVPAIHVFGEKKDVDARPKAGHDELRQRMFGDQFVGWAKARLRRAHHLRGACHRARIRATRWLA